MDGWMDYGRKCVYAVVQVLCMDERQTDLLAYMHVCLCKGVYTIIQSIDSMSD